MAKTKTEQPPVKKPIAQVRKENEELQEKLKEYFSYGYCYMFDRHKSKDKFYVCTDALVKSGITPICKECARRIAMKVGKDGKEGIPDKDSVKLALRYLNKPFFEIVWNASIQESESLIAARTSSNVWACYIKNIAMVNYLGMTYFDGEEFRTSTYSHSQDSGFRYGDSNESIIASKERNRRDVVHLLGYDPFVKESEEDHPFLYASLIGYLDASEDANSDRMRVSSIIEIVKGFNQVEKINDHIAVLINDVNNANRNIPAIKNLTDTKNKIINNVLGLAKDNGISLKHSVNASKGENTWTGKVRKMKEMNLMEAETNLYDVEYSSGLAQVADISNASILKQIRLDENDYVDMIAQQRELVTKYKKIADDSEEKARLLLRENNDLKASMSKHGLLTGGVK